MENPWIVIGLAPLPGLGNFTEGMVAGFVRVRPQLLTLVLLQPSNQYRHDRAHKQALDYLAELRIAAAFAADGCTHFEPVSAVSRMRLHRELREAGWRLTTRNKEMTDAA